MRDTCSHLIELENILELPNESGSEADNEFMMHTSPTSCQRNSYYPEEFYGHYYNRDDEEGALAPKKRSKRRSKEEGKTNAKFNK